MLGGVPRRGIYDNMRTAVDKVGRGKNRQVNARFAAMVSHFLFEAEFFCPAPDQSSCYEAPSLAASCIRRRRPAGAAYGEISAMSPNVNRFSRHCSCQGEHGKGCNHPYRKPA